MNNLEFRAWSKEEQKMYEVYEMDFINSLVCGKGFYKWFSYEEVEIMQYTGLQDKNGKEIYEGDIVRINNIFEVKVINGNTMITSNGLGLKSFLHIYNSNCEVIGNIYENGELLESDN